MTLPIRITYRHVEKSEPIERAVRLKAERLLRYGPTLLGCAVTISAPHRQHRQGNVYQVRIKLSLPGVDVVAGAEPALDHAHEDLKVAIRDAFRAARRALMDQVRVRRGAVKRHVTQPLA